jgi:hypothetical protein
MVAINMSEITAKSGGNETLESDWLEIVRRQVASIQYGVVEIIIHDSRVTQIEKTERLRLDRPSVENLSGRKQSPSRL